MLEFEDSPNKVRAKDDASKEAAASGASEPGEKTTRAVLPRVLLQHEVVVPSRIRLLKLLPRVLLLLGALLTAYGYRHKGALSDLSLSPSQLSDDPTQLDIDEDPFPLRYHGTTYTLEPLADYEFAGLVVSRNDISAFDDIYHTSDSVDVVDVCVVWGENIKPSLLSQFNFWSEPWSCNYQTDSRTAAQQFTSHQLSNNHLLPATEGIAAQLASIRIGDQVRIRGKLVDYYPDGNEDRRRQSSTTRTDTGNGACEVVYVEGVNILSRGTPLAYQLWNFGISVLLVAVLFSLLNFFVIPLSYYRSTKER